MNPVREKFNNFCELVKDNPGKTAITLLTAMVVLSVLAHIVNTRVGAFDLLSHAATRGMTAIAVIGAIVAGGGSLHFLFKFLNKSGTTTDSRAEYYT